MRAKGFPQKPTRRNFIKGISASAAGLTMAANSMLAPKVAKATSVSEVIVETRSGKLRGRRNERGVLSFLGVPYGAGTKGPGRFRAPAPVRPWAGIREAVHFGPYCPQAVHRKAYAQKDRKEVPRLMPEENSEFREDCLTLNVWSSATSGKRPVMVWLHGGAWTFGAPGGPEPPLSATNGDRLAETGEVVVVTVTHRIGVFGFCYLGELLGADYAESGNVGLLDLVAALEWVRDNIGSFGGDPDKVTIFGLSGGASKTAALYGMPRAKGLFHRAGCISGHPHYFVSPAEGTAMVLELLAEMGLGAGNAGKLLDAPTDQIITATSEMIRRGGGLMGAGLAGLKFSPVVDGRVFAEHPLDAIEAGVSADVPLLATVTREEATLQLIGDPNFDRFSDADLYQRVAVFLGDDATQAIKGYRQARPGTSSTELLYEIIGDHLMRLTTLETVERHLSRATVPCYMGMFCWQSKSLGGALRAYHGVDVPFIFDTLSRDSKIGADDAIAAELARRTRDAWISFAATGSPAHRGLPAWPAFDTKARSTMLLNGECRVESDPLRIARRHNRAFAQYPVV